MKLFWLIPALLLTATAALSELPFDDDEFYGLIAEDLFEQIGEAREAAGLEPVARDPAMDALAARRAGLLAARPRERRLPPEETLTELLRTDPAFAERRVRVRELIDVQRDIEDPGQAALDAWATMADAEDTLLEPRLGEVGLAVREADDGDLILVALFNNLRPVMLDWREIARDVEAEINAIRADAGLPRLRTIEELRRVARDHSEDMARRNYFDHVNPDGLTPGDRAGRAQIRFEILAENIGVSYEIEHPAAAIVQEWMDSEGHRRNIMDGRFNRTGVGIYIADDERMFITQLFMRPLRIGQSGDSSRISTSVSTP